MTKGMRIALPVLLTWQAGNDVVIDVHGESVSPLATWRAGVKLVSAEPNSAQEPPSGATEVLWSSPRRGMTDF